MTVAGESLRAAVIGARGYVGRELIGLIASHPDVELAVASSREFEGQRLSDHVSQLAGTDLCYQNLALESLDGLEVDVLFLALPDGVASRHDTVWQRCAETMVVIDMSADFRFAEHWCYGQPERCHDEIASARLIANPGCYATGMQLAIWPLLEQMAAVPVVFGVSGYSGAGINPSDKNDPGRLADNLLAYKPSGHTHEREVTRTLGHDVRFMPHVASHFRGIHLSVALQLQQSVDVDDLLMRFAQTYEHFPLIRVSRDIPEIQEVAGLHEVHIGGFDVATHDPSRVVVYCCLDNLLKGAATQAIQNMNLALALNNHHESGFGADHSLRGLLT